MHQVLKTKVSKGKRGSSSHQLKFFHYCWVSTILTYLHFCLLFHTATKVLIIGGEFDSEIFCPDSKDQCNAEYGNLNQETWYPVGGVLGSKVIICGGEQLVKTLLPFQLEKSDASLLI